MAEPNPVTPAEMESTIPEPTDAICTKLDALWSLANKVAESHAWEYDEDGNPSEEFKDAVSHVPVGAVMMWMMESAPDGWIVLNGSIVSRTGIYEDLFNLWGTRFGAGDGTSTWQLPNMARKFPFGASGTNPVRSTGGVEEVTLTRENLPAIKPVELSSGVTAFVMNVSTGGTDAIDNTDQNMARLTPEDAFEDLGEDEPFSVLNPYFSVHFIAKL